MEILCADWSLIIMFDRFKKNDEPNLQRMFEEMEMMSRINLLELKTGDVKWNDEQIQYFLPMVLNFTNFEWLDEIAKNEYPKDYEVISHFLDNVQKLMQIRANELEKRVRG